MHAPFFFQPHPQSNSWPRAPFSCYLGSHCVFFFDFFDRLFYCANTRMPATPSLPRYLRPPSLTRTQRLPPIRRAVATAGASSIPSGHSLLAISRQPPSSGADTCRMNCGRGRVAPGVEVCRCNGAPEDSPCGRRPPISWAPPSSVPSRSPRATSIPPSAAATARPRPRTPACCGCGRPHHRLLLRLVDCLLVRLWHWLRGRFLGLRLRLRSQWLGVSRRRWPGRPPRRRGQRGSSVAVSGFVREPLPLVAGSGWHLRQPPRRGWRAGLVPILAPRTGLLGRVPGGE